MEEVGITARLQLSFVFTFLVPLCGCFLTFEILKQSKINGEEMLKHA